ncbi:PXA domain-containing protein [Gorgonomyces haynaldii]|nr:PXA domain-containing protein [Gorgonomyces haynaldii]
MRHTFSNASLNRIFAHLRPQQLSSSTVVDEQLSKIITLLLRDYVSSWYEQISMDDDLFAEVSVVFGHIVAEIEHRLSKVDWVFLMTRDVPQILTQHIREFRSCEAKVGTAYAGGKSLEELFHGAQPHIALTDTETEQEYLRRVSDIIMDTLLPAHEFSSDTFKLLIREILTHSVLAMIVDYFSDPDYLNELILHAIDPGFFEDKSPQQTVPVEKAEVSTPISNATPEATPSISRSKKTGGSTLFEVKSNSFLKNRKKKPTLQTNSSFTQGLTKMSIGFEKMTSGIDKLKNMTIARQNRAKKRKETAFKNDLEFESLKLDLSKDQQSEIEFDYSVPLITTPMTPTIDPSPEPPEPEKPEIVEPQVLSVQTEPQERQRQESIIYRYLQQALSLGFTLYQETRVGPWRLGPIDTTKYDRYRLDENLVELLDEILDIQKRKKWIVTQLMFFIDPIVHGLAGHVINRAILRGVYFIIAEEQIANYLLIFRLAFWPNNHPAPNSPVRSHAEKEEIKAELESALLAYFEPFLSPLLGQDEAKIKIRSLMGVFQSKSINKHLIFVFLDLILAHLIPEYAEVRPSLY